MPLWELELNPKERSLWHWLTCAASLPFTLQAGCSNLHPAIFHTPLPHNQGDGPNPNPDDPDGGPNGGGSGDRDIPEDPAELPEDPLITLARAVHALVQYHTPKVFGEVDMDAADEWR
ncbi:hypothetical protein M404DRAFT_33559 [Pisolithus tinctorius Marx 270]|uniref:Uncharacterized protein n=1 Tax=Pisolithus tinctorius Marx 270 TaxID=870435 RepID=A0A0C3N4Z7_PISTI|nr:hypothetical protein M404DRAFT_33559 [Pisolithus tinctorius Marx 270]